MDFFKWAPIAIILAAMIFTGTKILEHCTISVVTIFKNTSVLVVALGDRFFYNKRHSILSYVSFLAIILSSVFGLFNDPGYSALGIYWLLLNCFFSATYVLGIKGISKIISFDNFDAVFNNNLIMMPIFCIISPFVDRWSVVLE